MGRTPLILTFILVALVVSVAGQKQITFDPNGGEFQIEGNKPAGFEDFERMYLETRRPRGSRVRMNGGLEVRGVEYAMRNIAFDGRRRWNFDTVSIGGVRYQFYGRFPKLRRDEHGAIIGDRVLKGRLIKFVRRKRSAMADLVFSFIRYSD